MATPRATNTDLRPVQKRVRHNRALETKIQRDKQPAPKAEAKARSPRQRLQRMPVYAEFGLWIVGATPLIVHAWSEKARREMLAKQVKATQPGKEAREPDIDYENSLYPMGEEHGRPFYGFPVTGIKNSLRTVAHVNKGVAKTDLEKYLWLNAKMYRTQVAHAGAICDLPLVRVYGSEPEMREDMVRVGVGMKKTATLAYRAQFTTWAIYVRGRFNTAHLTYEGLGFLFDEAGKASGIGEWRTERAGMFGAFNLAVQSEEQQWAAFAAGTGPLPKTRGLFEEPQLAMAAD